MEERFEKHREFLVDRIDPDFGLLDKLRANRILTREAVHKIKLKDNTTEDKNRILLDFILKNKKANELVSALRDSGQTHLVNYLNADGGYRSTFGDDWPLSECDISHLEINCEALVDLLDTSDLCIRLFSEKVINDRQKQFILSKPTNAEKNEALLEILTKCSLRQYYKTIACLNDSNQSHIAKLLSDGGVLVRVHVNLEGAVGNVDELEEEIITQIKKVLENRPLDDATRLLDLTKLGLIAARKGQSIVIYIHCMTHDNLLQLIDLLKTDRLKRTIERIFTELVSIGDDLRVTLTWSLEEFKRAATYFEVSFKMVVGKFKRAPSHGKLILLWDSIERIVRDSEEEESTLSEEHANRIRSQYSQLLNNLTRVPDIVAQMYERHKLSDKEREHLQQFHSTPIRASEELLNIIIGKSPDVYQCFLESLQKTRQHHVYQMLSTDQQTETTDEQHVSEHSCLIHKNYCWLTETLDPDCGLLPLLFQREVLNRREYEQIRCFHDSYKKNETLLSIISRKTSDNFKEFKNALIETLQSHIVDKLTVTVGRVSENARRARDILDTPIRPILLPEPLFELEAYQPEPNQVRGMEENSPVVMETQLAPKPFSTKLTLYLQGQFSKQREVSIKVVVMREKKMSHSIWKMCIHNLLQELQNRSLMIAPTTAASEKIGKEIANQFSIQLMDTPEKRGLAKDKINRFQHTENDSEKAEERLSQSQNQLLLLEPEKAMKLEMQIRAERYLQSEGDPVQQLIQLGASVENTEGKLVETDGNTHEHKLTLNQTDSDKPLVSPYDFEGIGSEEKLQSKYSTESVLIRTIATTAAKEEHKPIRGLTILDDELFVLSGESSAIEVFHSLKLTFNRRWERKELTDPWDIASCERTKRLYIMDYKSRDQSKAILVVNSNGKLLAKVKTGLDFGRLSITEQSNIIVTVFLKNKLIVYSPDGQLLNEVELLSQAGIVHPRHAIRLTNGDFVVSHGYLDYDLHGVCIVSADGALKKFYGGMSGSGIGELNIPNYLAVDKDGFVLVADRSNNRVILLNPDLKFEKEILSRTEHSLRHTTRMFLDESNGRLLVAENELDSGKTLLSDGYISIFYVK